MILQKAIRYESFYFDNEQKENRVRGLFTRIILQNGSGVWLDPMGRFCDNLKLEEKYKNQLITNSN
jgi:hypothetical protein